MNYNFQELSWILSLLPKGTIGAEIGVFTGMFSAKILEIVEPAHVSFVDIWTMQGEFYDDWEEYTDYGRLKTEDAEEAVRIRTQSYQSGEIDIVESDSLTWLSEQKDGSLDWIYLDTTHKYELTFEEIKSAAPKLKQGGILIGDD